MYLNILCALARYAQAHTHIQIQPWNVLISKKPNNVANSLVKIWIGNLFCEHVNEEMMMWKTTKKLFVVIVVVAVVSAAASVSNLPIPNECVLGYVLY